MRHGRCVDCGIGPDDGRGEVVVFRGIGDFLEAHADCDGSGQLGSVVGGDGS